MVAKAEARQLARKAPHSAESHGPRESGADRLLSAAAMVGSAVGAVGGVFVGAELGIATPTTFGMIGIMIGCASAVGGWWLLARSKHEDAHEPGHDVAADYPNVQCRIK